MLVNQDGTVNGRNYYYPYGGNRGGSAFSGITTKRFTGQYHEQGLPGGERLSYCDCAGMMLVFDDEGHSAQEAREIIIGHSVTNRLLLVCLAERSGNRIRLISGRVVTKKERQDYENYVSSRK